MFFSAVQSQLQNLSQLNILQQSRAPNANNSAPLLSPTSQQLVSLSLSLSVTLNLSFCLSLCLSVSISLSLIFLRIEHSRKSRAPNANNSAPVLSPTSQQLVSLSLFVCLSLSLSISLKVKNSPTRQSSKSQQFRTEETIS